MLTTLAATLFLCGCRCNDNKSSSTSASNTENQVDLHLWHTFNPEETRTLNEVLEEIRQAHPGWSIRSTVIPFGRAQNELRRTVKACEPGAPDVFRAELPWIPGFAEEGLLRPVPDDTVTEGAYVSNARKASRYKGKRWILPSSQDCLALLYDRRVVSAAPATVAAYVKQAQRLSRDTSGRTGADPGFEPQRAVRWGTYVRGDAYWFLPFLWAAGGRTLNPATGEVYIDQPAAVQALAGYRDIIREHHAAPPRPSPANDYEEMMQRFGRGQVAMIINGPWALAAITATPAFEDPAHLGIAPLPRGPGGEPSAPISGHGFAVSRCTRSPAAALALAHALAGLQAQVKFARRNSLLPALEAAYHQPGVRQNRLVTRFHEALGSTRSRPVHPVMSRIFDDFTPAVQAVLLGDASPEEALAGVARAWRSLLAPTAAPQPAGATSGAEPEGATHRGGHLQPSPRPGNRERLSRRHSETETRSLTPGPRPATMTPAQ